MIARNYHDLAYLGRLIFLDEAMDKKREVPQLQQEGFRLSIMMVAGHTEDKQVLYYLDDIRDFISGEMCITERRRLYYMLLEMAYELDQSQGRAKPIPVQAHVLQ